MKGFLSYLVLWVLREKSLTGSEIAEELGRRKGAKPASGTIYPALRELKEKGLIKADKKKAYSLTPKGKKELSTACTAFCTAFYDLKEMFSCSSHKGQ